MKGPLDVCGFCAKDLPYWTRRRGDGDVIYCSVVCKDAGEVRVAVDTRPRCGAFGCDRVKRDKGVTCQMHFDEVMAYFEKMGDKVNESE